VTDKPTLDVIYDGECPFCSRYATMVRLRERGIDIRLHDAREKGTFAAFPEARSYDLDEGMLARWNGRWYWGPDAMLVISQISGSAPLAALMRNPRASRLAYPVLRAGRNLTLRLLGRSKISRDRDT
jgi:predicted DCC family thiol-disulfide oxidoreductase YuxK